MLPHDHLAIIPCVDTGQMSQKLQDLINEVDTECIRDTVGNVSWLKANFNSVVQAIPEQWSSVPDLVLPFGFAIKCLGVEWRELSQVIVALYWLTHIGIAESRVDPHGSKGSTRSLIYRRSTNCANVLTQLNQL